MARDTIIRRTEKLREIKALLEDKRVLCIGAFLYSGKTVLLDQLERRLGMPVLRFDCARDDWDAFGARVRELPGAALLIDSLDRLEGEANRQALSRLLLDLPEGGRAVVAGRGQRPAFLNRLLAGGGAAVLDWEFVMLSEPEIRELLLEYGVTVSAPDLAFLKRWTFGWPVAIHMFAQRKLAAPEHSARALYPRLREDLRRLLASDALRAFPEADQALVLNLSPFEAFTEEMARVVTGRTDAPNALADIAQRSHMLFSDAPGRYRFMPILRETLLRELENRFDRDYIDGLYQRAALYYELANQVPQAVRLHIRLNNLAKVRELLVRDSRMRPGNGDHVELKEAYALLSEEEILSSPELMKGMCFIESLLCRPEESERWYAALKRFEQGAPAGDALRREAVEALAWLDIVLPHRGSADMLKTLVATARLRALTESQTWRQGFNASGNSVTLMNGGKDFCRWLPHGWTIYRLFKGPVERALGRGGTGLGDVAIAECELETNLKGDYTLALDKVCAGLSRLADDTEMRCAAVGIQSRILAAQGGAEAGREMINKLIAALPEDAPARLRQNLEIHRLSLSLLLGETDEAAAWLETDAPDETGDFNIMDRYGYMLKLRLYALTAQWSKLPLLSAKLRHYFETYDRPYQRAQLRLLQAVADWRVGNEAWRDELTEGLALAKRYRLARMVADEGIAIVDMLNALELPEGPWERGVLELTRAQAARYPSFMKQIAVRPVFTPRESQVYSLMIAGYRNAKIASILNITERTVKFHTAEIYAKLGVGTRAEAINRAAELGDIR